MTAAGVAVVPIPSCWFLVLADRDPVVRPPGARRMLRYASGRPWIVGNWPDDAMVSAVAGRSRLALIGCAATNARQLLRLLLSARDVHALDLARAVAGDYHVIAEIDSHRRVQGSPTGTRRVFTARLGSHLVAADRADVLARLTGAPLNRTALALSLLDPSPPHPLDDLVLWESIDALPPDHYLLVGPDEKATVLRWWRRPAPVRSRTEGAPTLRAALAEAVAARVAGGGTVSCDLSGGLSSTSVCCLAARGPADVVALTGIAPDPGDDDAARAAATLPGVTREILPAAGLPLVYDGIADADEPLDRPFVGIGDRAKLRAGLDRVALYGPRVHLTGFGGDEVAYGCPAYLPRLLRRRPRRALHDLRGHRAQEGWPWMACLRMMRPRGYRDCLADMADALDQARRATVGHARRPAGSGRSHPGVLASLDWAFPPVVPGWLTPTALDLLAGAFAEAVRRARPLAETRDGHADLFAIRAGAAVFRLFDQLADPVGPPLAAPFLDERVVRAVLAVRPEERTGPWEYKPLLQEAMRRLVPQECLRRETKADTAAEEDQGLRTSQDVLVKLCDDSPLADLGLIESDALRQACRSSSVPGHRHQALRPTFAADAWLRVLASRRGPD
ncbi:asparagine synthase (glutamine-hydrolysing) [Frankia casuarinae]|uniref:asparagine synthase-related protein n=1 Tax=Frankia TaxID=1854 RepID=UPI0002F31D93|nr:MULTISPECIES: asparagine synthase-related protein [Frankia]EYT91558.1 asparagine synthase (glutamine-hydrolysing) [Frankia casuarinae]KDA44838.1 asparagine synthase (glutamine-hydrolysing) [Frankia sp. BMG5.23]